MINIAADIHNVNETSDKVEKSTARQMRNSTKQLENEACEKESPPL